MLKLTFFVCLIAFIQAAEIYSKSRLSLEEVQLSNIPKIEFNILDVIPLSVLKEIEEGKFDVYGITANLNEYADKIFANVQNFMIHMGLDPFSMPDLHEGFNFTLIITYHGEMDLKNGWIEDIATIHRAGDVLLNYDHDKLYFTIAIPIGFNEMQFTYDYSLKFMNLGPSGGIEGKVKDVKCNVVLGFDTDIYHASVDKFEIDSGHISFHFTGNILTDWILNIVSEVTTTMLKRVILWVVQTIVGGVFNAVVELINDVIDQILHPATTTTVAPIIKEIIKNFN